MRAMAVVRMLLQGGSALTASASYSCSCPHAPFLMQQPSGLRKGLHISWKALRRFSGNCVQRRSLFKPITTVNFSTSAWFAPVSAGFRFELQAQAAVLGSFAKNGSAEIKLTRDDDDILQKAIVYEAERGFPNTVGRTKRFSEFLSSKLSALSNANTNMDKMLTSLSNLTQSYDNMDIDDRVAVLNKVCSMLGFKCVQDLVDQHNAVLDASKGLQINTGSSEHNALSNKNHITSWQKMSHPAIVFGSSERIDLFNFTDKERNNVSVNQPLFSRKITGTSPSSLSSEAHLSASDSRGKGTTVLHNQRGPTSQVKKAKRTVKRTKASNTDDEWLLNKPISTMECLSPTICLQLEENGFYTLRKLLQHYPRNYLNFLQPGPRVEDGQFLTFSGEIVSCRCYSANNLGIVEVLIASTCQPADDQACQEKRSDNKPSDSVIVHVKKFLRGSRYSSKWFLDKLAQKYPIGTYAAVSGKVKAMEQENHFELKEYNFELLNNSKLDAETKRVYPVYPSKGGLDQKFFELCLQKVLPEVPLNIDPLPEKYKTAYGLMDLREAYVGIHWPQNLEAAEKARIRFVFDEFLYLQLGLLSHKQELSGNKDCASADMEGAMGQQGFGKLPIEKWAPLASKMLASLPYKLTDSQLAAVSEIMWDLQKPAPMRRLLQGDVGCGKTIVAFLALLEVIDAGLQGALMTPTEFLAKQQYERFINFVEHLEEKSRPQIALLTSSVTAIKARAVRVGLESGEIQLVVGTHSLISNSVKFASLGLAIIDEQHRFGVEQRIRLLNKGGVMLSEQDVDGKEEGRAVFSRRSPHVLTMTATPIPRTLAFTLYGDMDLSQITELPEGRIPVKTLAILGDKEGLDFAFEMVHKELQAGGRVFIVYAFIDESEELPNIKAASVEFERISKHFEGFTCGLVHGKLKSTERDAAMSAFKSGLTQVLVTTSIVEVGIDIPEASMMVVVNAERYGLAQLHQLRGRVGRGTRKSTCVLLASSVASLQRLNILETSTDGFHLAEVDLQQRGPGDILGKKQSGHLAEFSLARLNEDGELLVQARKTAEEILREHPGLEGLPWLKRELGFRQGTDSVGL